jgi:hypothetical protein
VALIYLAGLVVVWFAPETKGKPMCRTLDFRLAGFI